LARIAITALDSRGSSKTTTTTAKIRKVASGVRVLWWWVCYWSGCGTGWAAVATQWNNQ